MSALFDPTDIPTAPETTVSKEQPKPAAKTKTKRKSYYIPVAQREAAKKAARSAKKAEQAVREAKSTATKSSVKKVETKKVETKKVETKKDQGDAVCSICHKPLSRHTSVDNGMGDVCASKMKLLPKGKTLEDHYEDLSVADVPAGYIKLKDAIKKINAKGISTYRILQAIGGDRMLRGPINKNFKVVFVGRTRYINGASVSNWRDLEKV